eukprot:gnl/TRDRNA2_/TRDRNA2_185011_c0_seq1.p1 gnl/TRDRNA2_/TRDRNA2_185011_c0~~gnl/TRDRNA2_/TRDRNA2_185011_c0_seq1.p1  ORF type:complete len:214 (+),score=17.59 gnl/TRDRNA2_/TRDRNA2_185011_c0_seq1:87-728(+)
MRRFLLIAGSIAIGHVVGAGCRDDDALLRLNTTTSLGQPVQGPASSRSIEEIEAGVKSGKIKAGDLSAAEMAKMVETGRVLQREGGGGWSWSSPASNVQFFRRIARAVTRVVKAVVSAAQKLVNAMMKAVSWIIDQIKKGVRWIINSLISMAIFFGLWMLRKIVFLYNFIMNDVLVKSRIITEAFWGWFFSKFKGGGGGGGGASVPAPAPPDR